MRNAMMGFLRYRDICSPASSFNICDSLSHKNFTLAPYNNH